MNKVNPFPAVATHCPLMFFQSLSNTDEIALVSKLGKKSLAKGTTRSVSDFLSKLPVILPNILPRNSPNCIYLDNQTLLSFISVAILLPKVFLILSELLETVHVAILHVESFS